MKIVWDEPKRQSNLAKHGVDFAEIGEEFFLSAVIRPAKNGRLAAFGWLDKGAIAVIFASLGSEGVSLISARTASRKERELVQ